MESDEILLDRWRAGDDRAGGELFERYFQALYRFFHNKLGRDVEDLIQQTFLSCIAHKDDFRLHSSFRTYLLKIARNKLFDYLRSHSRSRVEPDFGMTSVMDLGTGLSVGLAKMREQDVLLASLRMIPVELQEVLELFYWEELTSPQMAEILGIPEGTVRSRLRRAREALGERFSSYAGSAGAALDLDRLGRSVGQELKGATLGPSGRPKAPGMA